MLRVTVVPPAHAATLLAAIILVTASILFAAAVVFFTPPAARASGAASVTRRGDPALGFEFAYAASVSIAEPFTIHSRFRYTGGMSAPVIILGGLASKAGGLPDALAVTWTQDATGWFPVWRLRIEARTDLFRALPAGLVDRRDGNLALIDLADVRPEAGREYRAAVSYDPADRILSILLEDVPAGSVVYAAHLELGAADAALPGAVFPVAGWSASEPAPAAPARSDGPAPSLLLEFSVSRAHERHGLPLALKSGFRSALLEASPETGALRRKLGSDYLQGETVGLRLEWPNTPVPGEVRVILAGAGEEIVLTAAPWRAGVQDIVFEPGDLPAGSSTLVLEYAHGTHRSEIARHPVQVVDATLQASYVIRGRDYDRDLIIAELALTPSAGVARDGELVVVATYPELQGESAARPFVALRHPFEALDRAVSFSLLIPAPPEPGPVRLEVSIRPGHAAILGGVHQFTLREPGVGRSYPDLFPFVVSPWQESPDNLTNVAHWLDRPAGKNGFISIEDGHFVTGDGSRVRFFGVNCAFAGCFPDHATAERIARQLARFGVNLVRIHHIDMQEAPGGIWSRGTFPRRFDPRQLDRLDYFIHQLKENGIYTNLNLHVSRTMTPQEGYPEPEKRPDFDKGLSLYDSGIIEHQKAYARELLTHRNPYTGNRYVDEPAVAMIEITNEDGLIYIARRGLIDALPDMYREALDARWQEWLLERYGTTEKLAAAWDGLELPQDAGTDPSESGPSGPGADGSSGTGPAPPSEIAANGRLEQGLAHWTLETGSDSRANMRVVPADGQAFPTARSGSNAETAPQSPRSALEVAVTQKGSVAWRPQVYHTGLNLVPGKAYRVSFWLKSSRPHSITANLMMHHDPWSAFATFQPAVTTEWRRFEFVARIPVSVDVRQGRVSFTNLEEGAVYWIAHLSVEELPGDGLGLPPGESLGGKVSRPEWHSLAARSSRVRQDYIEFLWEVEREYFEEMYRFIKEELGARVPVSGTQVPWSPQGIQARLDYIDAHAYWNHPEFPGTPWDAANWLVRNNSMIASADGGTIGSLARSRVAGKPFVVSEYNHPAPITFGSEAFVLTGAYGAFQDWDGLVAFAWSHDANFWPQRITNFFDLKAHPAKLVTLPAVAALFLRGDVRPGEQVVTALVPDDTQRRRLAGMEDAPEIPPSVALQHRVAVAVDEARTTAGESQSLRDEERGAERGATANEPRAPAGSPSSSPQGPVVTSDTGELRWERTGPGRAVATIDTARSKAVVGYGAGRTFDLSGVTVRPGPTKQQGWSAITLTVMDGGSFAGPGRILITATGYVENPGMGWERLGGDAITVRNRWGEAPTYVEGIPARIELPARPDRVIAFALDGAGYRREPLPVRASDGSPERAVIDIGPQYRTLWYEIIVD